MLARPTALVSNGGQDGPQRSGRATAREPRVYATPANRRRSTIVKSSLSPKVGVHSGS